MSERDRISTTADTGDIRCPFFIGHGKRDIVCEGMIDGARMITSFSDAEGKAWHQRNYCEQQYCRCEMYCSIKHWKWPDDECD